MRALCAAVIVLVGLAACGSDPAADDAAPSTAATTTTRAATPSPEPAPSPTPSKEETAWEDMPSDLAARLPSEAEFDQLVREAEDAYRVHRATYDATAATGFTDAELVAELMAGAGWRTLESLEAEAAAIADAGHVVDGATDVVGMELFGFSPPEDGWPGLGLVFDVCLDVHGTLHERDGTVVREIGSGERAHLQARLMEHEGGWLLMEQAEQEGPCPEHLSP